ncbi:MAG: ribosomal protein S18-alanine N-acetyltransferase [Bacillota bacterium]|nr:ribosomal protein S18-alanine N-acetyltransferase [Bacillota bacterium]
MADGPVYIRPAGVHDLASLVELEQTCSGMPWHGNSLLQDLINNKAAHYWVAVDPAGMIVGYISCWVVLDEAEITNLAVLPKCRRLGIARKLLHHLIGRLQMLGVVKIFLDVRETNKAAIALYSRSGFLPAGNRPAYYADTGETAIIMSQLIGESDKGNVQKDNKE